MSPSLLVTPFSTLALSPVCVFVRVCVCVSLSRCVRVHGCVGVLSLLSSLLLSSPLLSSPLVSSPLLASPRLSSPLLSSPLLSSFPLVRIRAIFRKRIPDATDALPVPESWYGRVMYLYYVEVGAEAIPHQLALVQWYDTQRINESDITHALKVKINGAGNAKVKETSFCCCSLISNLVILVPMKGGAYAEVVEYLSPGMGMDNGETI